MRSKVRVVYCSSKSRHFCGVIAKKSAKKRGRGAKLPSGYFEKFACEKQYGWAISGGTPNRKRSTSEIMGQTNFTGLVCQKVDTFAVSLQKNSTETKWFGAKLPHRYFGKPASGNHEG